MNKVLLIPSILAFSLAVEKAHSNDFDFFADFSYGFGFSDNDEA